MTFRKPSILLALFFLTAVPALAQSVDEIVEKSIEAKGGLEKIRAIESMKQQGVSSMMGMDMPVTIYVKRPSMMRTEMEMQGQLIVSAFDGATAWMINPMMGAGAQKLPAEQAEGLKGQADLDGVLVNYRDKGFTITYEGEETAGGKSFYKLAMTDPNGESSVMYLDERYLIARTQMERTNPMTGEQASIVVSFHDYRSVGGVQMPHDIRIEMNGQLFQQMKMELIEINKPIDDALFAFPGK